MGPPEVMYDAHADALTRAVDLICAALSDHDVATVDKMVTAVAVDRLAAGVALAMLAEALRGQIEDRATDTGKDPAAMLEAYRSELRFSAVSTMSQETVVPTPARRRRLRFRRT